MQSKIAGQLRFQQADVFGVLCDPRACRGGRTRRSPVDQNGSDPVLEGPYALGYGRGGYRELFGGQLETAPPKDMSQCIEMIGVELH